MGPGHGSLCRVPGFRFTHSSPSVPGPGGPSTVGAGRRPGTFGVTTSPTCPVPLFGILVPLDVTGVWTPLSSRPGRGEDRRRQGCSGPSVRLRGRTVSAHGGVKRGVILTGTGTVSAHGGVKKGVTRIGSGTSLRLVYDRERLDKGFISERYPSRPVTRTAPGLSRRITRETSVGTGTRTGGRDQRMDQIVGDKVNQGGSVFSR